MDPMASPTRRPPLYPEMAELIAAFTSQMSSSAAHGHLTDKQALALDRQGLEAAMFMDETQVRSDPDITVEERRIPGPRGDIPIVILRKKSDTPTSKERPGIVWYHGGGMVVGNAFLGISCLVGWVKDLDVIAVSVDYRLAPESPAPAPSEDCYAALVWVGEHLKDLGIASERLVVGGNSAGGSLAASVALMVRDKGGPKLRGQFLGCPMLDDRNSTVSCSQFYDLGICNTALNIRNWRLILGDRAGGEDVSIYEAPGRATDLSDLPPTYIDVGAAEPFRDEDVAYAINLCEGGADVELHVWPGTAHGWELLVKAEIPKLAAITQSQWMKRHLLLN